MARHIRGLPNALPVPIHDVRDISQFIAICLEDQLQRRGAYLDTDQWRDAHSFLQETVLREMNKWDSQKHPLFSDWVRVVVTKRFVDWYRKELGDSRYKTKRPEVVSIDQLAHGNGLDLDGENSNVTDEKGAEELSSPDFSEDTDIAVSIRQTFSCLSPKGLWILQNIAMPVSEKTPYKDIAETHGKSNRWVREQLAVLREELEQLGVGEWL